MEKEAYVSQGATRLARTRGSLSRNTHLTGSRPSLQQLESASPAEADMSPFLHAVCLLPGLAGRRWQRERPVSVAVT